MFKTIFASTLLASTIAGVHLASAEEFSQMIAFSGALSDTGNYNAELGKDRPAPFYKNRSTNGPVAVEELARWLGMAAEPSMHLTAKTGGTNFAVADALAGGHGPHDLPAQVDAFLERNGGKADPNALYFVFIGGNDVIKAVQEMDDATSRKTLSDAVDGIELQIKRLVENGAKTIYAPDFIDVGKSPAVLAYGPEASARATMLSDEYNRQFDAMLDKIDDGSFTLIRWSFDDFVKDIEANGSRLGLTNATEACLDVADKCDVDRFIYLTGEYPTARVHQMLGSAMALSLTDRMNGNVREAKVN
ncbi:SGNH/GDSL hydrolase family protein [Paracoccus aminophilus]|uniref:Phospholipase/lecithinase/hemolysin-like protein n=1 Tax=Paracoccus aminophilus JCM 7686 TaxID=1367847 RepID=S5XNQ6_PARAH|nr:SGNH/GDSL hydrolase family protein [Paracoccus aminophilus]AGT08964.1 phospholipase/lecithinase/hemolysin-like protein [Paracoccus aminophilus JCM 7686]